MEGGEIPEALSAQAALLDGDGVIVAVNDAWRRFGVENGLTSPDACIGTNYLALCRSCLGEAHRLSMDLNALLRGRSVILTWLYACDTPQGRRWFNLVGVPRADGARGALIAHVDLSPLVAGGTTGAPEDRPTLETSVSALAPTRAGLLDAADAGEADADPATDLTGLTARQAQVLALVRESRTNEEIAAALSISVGAVKKHVAALLKAFGVSGRRDLRTGPSTRRRDAG
ncbi:helix-turn-helix transcriptional regulator [Salinarimonas sp.]|uniref:helix-turn-helix transcriptional regulator n=1 Tax=Salinarimonas sp. TaxID=2766526 RepID=UPI0032D965E9